MTRPMIHRLVTTVFTLSMIGTAGADTLDVPGTYTSIQAAVNAAADGDTVLVGPGTYLGSGDQVVSLEGKKITLRSTDGPAVTIIDGERVRRGLTCDHEETAETVIDGFTITRCATNSDGGGIACENGSAPTITNCHLISNTTAGRGGGIAIIDSTPTLIGCTIANNNASTHGGGVAIDQGTASLTDCTVLGNQTPDTFNRHGGGIYCEDGELILLASTIAANSASGRGGGLYCHSSELTIAGTCDISRNTSRSAAGLYCQYGQATISDCTVSNNNATDTAGGLYGINLILDVSDSTFEFNQAVNAGGGMFAETSGGDIDDDTVEDRGVRLTNCVFRGNIANTGGGLHREHEQLEFDVFINEPPFFVTVYSDSRTEITDCTFENNLAWLSGGGLHLIDGHYYWGPAPEIDTSPTITNCTFSGNTAMNGAGGGLWARESSTRIESCTFQDNQANYPTFDPQEFAGFGGGVSFAWNSYDVPGDPAYAIFAPQLHDCHFTGNTANFDGGGLHLESAGHNLNSTGCIFDSNHAGRHGGGLHGGTQGFTITNGTFSGNTAVERGGGIHCDYSINVDEIIHSCLFTANVAQHGGGIACSSAATQVIQSTFDANSAVGTGGGVRCNEASSLVMIECVFTGNDAGDRGGGFSSHDSSPAVLESCTFIGNSASGEAGRGGGIACVNLTATNCNMTNNTATRFGGGIACWSYGVTPNCTIIGSTITGNLAMNGGGVHAGQATSPTLVDCLIADNEALQTGGGLSGRGDDELTSNLDIDGCTITGNTAMDSGGIAFSFPPDIILNTLASSTVRGNDCQGDSLQITGYWNDPGDNDVIDGDCACPSDIDGNGVVAVDDMLEVIGQWEQPGGPADVNNDGIVNVTDVLQVISDWGLCA